MQAIRNSRKPILALVAALAAFTVFFAFTREAGAVPSFARKYKTSCLTCHTVYPMLNSFGEAFRRNGYRFPSQDGSMDSDNIKDEQLPLGQPEYRKMFPDTVWPDQIAQAVPLSVMVNGTVSYNFPDSDAHAANGNAFSWNGVTSELHLFGAGALTDSLTYFAQLTVTDAGPDLETGYLLMNDIVGPRHLVNIWVGRLFAPQLTSFGLHSSYLSDTVMPATSIAALYNPTGSFTLGQGHTDGVEVNGIAGHRFTYALGWIASGAISGVALPTSEDAYAHIGVKIGGMSLDGEGDSGMQSADAKHPWSETSLTLDGYAYHGLSRVDSGTGVGPGSLLIYQDDQIFAAGGQARASIQSLLITAGAIVERHDSPYQGTAADPGPPPAPGAQDFSHGTSFSQYAEADYVVYPWLVPGVRTEYTQLTTRPSVENADHASLLRITPGVAFAIRPNVRLITTGTFEYATGLPPAGSWSAAGGFIQAPPGTASKVEAEQINATLAWAF
jgi:hypothetical protein